MRNKLMSSVAGAAFSFAASGLAFAADMAAKAPPPVVAPVSNWTGFYVGGNVGGAWSHDNATLSFPDTLSAIDPLTVNTGSAAVIGGFQEGFNWQFAPTWVWGIEADWSFTDAGRSLSQPLTSGGHTIPAPFSSSTLGTKLDWLGSARNRLGYLITPNLMLYGTGGVAWGKIDYTGAASLNTAFIYSANTAFSRTAVGWTAGAGLEWMITEHWLLRGEYLFYDLSSAQSVNSVNKLTFTGLCIITQPNCPPPPIATATFSWANMSVNEVRAALSYKF